MKLQSDETYCPKGGVLKKEIVQMEHTKENISMKNTHPPGYLPVNAMMNYKISCMSLSRTTVA